ncbi:MAG: GNAT family N-acetyltransferase [Acidocella sp.]|nr:GNAT family N-acetyltransferase [Acidocella sp.]
MPATDYVRPGPGEPTDRALVTVTFLRMTHRPTNPPPALPRNAMLTPERMGVPAYRALYDRVGTPWLWWLRRVMPDEQLARHLAAPNIMTHLLRVDGELAGFFETETARYGVVNLNYFGLCPAYLGRGLGRAMLGAAVGQAYAANPRLAAITLNTCTADHPRALPNYLEAGFKITRQVQEIWDIPRRLGMVLPEHVRGG